MELVQSLYPPSGIHELIVPVVHNMAGTHIVTTENINFYSKLMLLSMWLFTLAHDRSIFLVVAVVVANIRSEA